jgi:phage terminase small subunit
MKKKPIEVIPKLTTKKKLFALEYLTDSNATRAAKSAGYSEKTAYSQGQRLLKDVEVQKIIQSKINKIEVTADMVLAEIAKIAFFNVKDIYKEDGSLKSVNELSPDVSCVIAGIETSLLGITKYKFHDKSKNLENLGRHFSMFTDNVKNTVEIYEVEEPDVSEFE